MSDLPEVPHRVSGRNSGRTCPLEGRDRIVEVGLSTRLGLLPAVRGGPFGYELPKAGHWPSVRIAQTPEGAFESLESGVDSSHNRERTPSTSYHEPRIAPPSGSELSGTGSPPAGASPSADADLSEPLEAAVVPGFTLHHPAVRREAGVAVSLLRWFRSYPAWWLFQLAGILVLGGAGFFGHWLFWVYAGLWLIYLLGHLALLRDHASAGYVYPGIVVGTDPCRVAVLMDLASDTGSRPVIKVTVQPLHRFRKAEPQLFERVPCVVTFEEFPGLTHYLDARVTAIECLTGDPRVTQWSLARVPEDEWNALVQAWRSVDKPTASGVYPLCELEAYPLCSSWPQFAVDHPVGATILAGVLVLPFLLYPITRSVWLLLVPLAGLVFALAEWPQTLAIRLCPGVLLSESRRYVAVLLNVGLGGHNYPAVVIRELPASLLKGLEDGDEVLFVAELDRYACDRITDYSQPAPDVFRLHPVGVGRFDRSALRRLIRRLHVGGIETLKRALARIPVPYTVGCYPVRLPDSDWR